MSRPTVTQLREMIHVAQHDLGHLMLFLPVAMRIPRGNGLRSPNTTPGRAPGIPDPTGTTATATDTATQVDDILRRIEHATLELHGCAAELERIDPDWKHAEMERCRLCRTVLGTGARSGKCRACYTRELRSPRPQPTQVIT